MTISPISLYVDNYYLKLAILFHSNFISDVNLVD